MNKASTLIAAAAFLFLSACSSVPYCYRSTDAEGEKIETLSCPAWMCRDRANTNPICVSKTGGAKPSSQPATSTGQTVLHRLRPIQSSSAGEKPKPAKPHQAKMAVTISLLAAVEIGPNTALKDVPDHYYALQVSALNSKEAAEAHIKKLSLDAAIIPIDSSHGPAFAIIVDYQETKEKALQAAERYKYTYGGDTWSRRVFDLQAAAR